MLRMRKRLVPYVDPLAREVSNPRAPLVGWYVEEDVAEDDDPPEARPERKLADIDA